MIVKPLQMVKSRQRIEAALSAILLLLAMPVCLANAQDVDSRGLDAVGLGPQGVVRRFCQLDGQGLRLTGIGWTRIQPLVAWRFEPAWDHVALITGYQVGGPYPADNAMMIDVRYTVLGQISAAGQDDVAYTETVSFRVTPSESGDWQIAGPLLPPHLFGSRLDLAAVRRTLAADNPDYVSDSGFVWRMLRSAGWEVANERTHDLLNGATYRPVDRPAVGDVVAYLYDGAPYHVGLLADEDQVVSATINAGIVQASVDAFPGEVTYLRLVEPVPAATPAAEPTREPAAPNPTMVNTATPQHTPTAQLSRSKTVRKAGQVRRRKRERPQSPAQLPALP